MGNSNRSSHTNSFIGGLLSIVSAGITLSWIVIVFIIEYIRYLSGDLPFPPGAAYFEAFFGLRIILMVASVFAIIGGISAFKRRYWPLSLLGVISSILCIPMFLGIIATIYISKAKKEFQSTILESSTVRS